MTELEEALLLADKFLDEPYADPDSDINIIARQLVRLHSWVKSPAGWQPIISAPKDGTTIIIFDGNFVREASWCSLECKDGTVEYWGSSHSHSGLCSDPHYWMPLPEPPKGA